MPRQIRCRCGQQLQVRHSEWTYIAASLGIVGLLVNIVVIIYLYTRLNEVESNLAEKLANQQPVVKEASTTAAIAPARLPGDAASSLKQQPGASQLPAPKAQPEKGGASPQEKKTTSAEPPVEVATKDPSESPEEPLTIARSSPPPAPRQTRAPPGPPVWPAWRSGRGDARGGSPLGSRAHRYLQT